MPTVEVDEATDQYLEFAARIAGLSKGQVVARLVAIARSTAPEQDSSVMPEDVKVHADYGGYRTRAVFIPGPRRIEIADGPLANTTYRSPSAAARAIVEHYNPQVSSHRNGWRFWTITHNSNPLETIRYEHIRGRATHD